MPELDSSCFAICEEMRSIEVQKSHVFQIEYDRLFDRIHLCLQRLNVLRFDSAIKPENRYSSIHDCLDFEDHLRISPMGNATAMPHVTH